MRTWIIGTGPSLSAADLNVLHNHHERCYSVNRIHLVFRQTVWRPDVVLMGDFMRSQPALMVSDLNEHAKHGYPYYVRSDFMRHYPHGLPKQVVLFRDCEHGNLDKKPDRWYLPDLCKFGGSLFPAMQLAVREGATQLVLLGVRGTFSSDERTNHFVPDYLPAEVQRTPEQARSDNANLLAAHQLAAKECEARGVEILNATPDTELSCYPRVALASLF